MDTANFKNLQQFEDAAKKKLKGLVGEYFYSGTNQSFGIKRNLEALQKIMICPNICVDVSKRCTETTFMGKEYSMPIGIGPCALHCLTNDEGEIATAKAAEQSNILYVISHYSTRAFKDIRREAPNATLFMQMNMLPEKFLTKEYIKNFESQGVNGFVLTVDHNSFAPDRPTLDREIRSEMFLPNMPEGFCEIARSAESVNSWTSDSYTWESVEKIISYTTLPVLIKGILSPKNAVDAVRVGAAGIWVSNHGGRNNSDCPSTIEAFKRIAPIVKKSGIPLFADGGIRTGSDVIKFLALGAKMVFLAKPVISALTVNGREGLNDMFSILKDDLEATMALCGYNSVDEVNEDCLWDSKSKI